MRCAGSSSVTSNRACVLVTTSVYDRRAIDSPLGSLPLSSSLQHLAYLTSTSPRIREIVTTDGGLERLMVLVGRCLDRLLPDSSFSASSKGAGSVSFDDKFHGTKRRRNRSTPFKPFSVYINARKRAAAGEPVQEWIDKPAILQSYGYALQSLVNVGVRGSEAIRTRVVDSGVLLTVARILNTFLAQRQQERERRSAIIAPSKSVTLWREDMETNDDAAGSSASAVPEETTVPTVQTIAPTTVHHHPMQIQTINPASPPARQQQHHQHGLVLTLPTFVDARMMSASPTVMSFAEEVEQPHSGQGSSRQPSQTMLVSLAPGSSFQITTPAPSPTASSLSSSGVLSLPPFISRLSTGSTVSASAASSIRRANTPDTIASIDETIEHDVETQGEHMREARVVTLDASCDEANHDAESASLGGATNAEELDAAEIPTDTDDGVGSTTSSRANSRSRPNGNASIVKCPSNNGNTDTDMDDDAHDHSSGNTDPAGVDLNERQRTITNADATPLSTARALTIAPEHAHMRHNNADVVMHGVSALAQRQVQSNPAATSAAAHRAPSMSATPQRQLHVLDEDVEEDHSASATAIASVATSTNPSSQSLRDHTLPQMGPPPDHLLKEDDVLHCLHLLAYLSKYPHVRAIFHDPEHEEYRPVPPPIPTTSSSCAHVPKRRRCGENGETCSAAWEGMQNGEDNSRDEDADDDEDDSAVVGSSRLTHNRPSRSHHHHHHHNHSQSTETRSFSLPRLPFAPSAQAHPHGHFLAVPGQNPAAYVPSHGQSCCVDADLERAKALAALPAKDRKPAAEPAKPPRSTANNVFSLVEQFTFRPSSPAERSMRLPTDIQYWAGVIMRNACRKDELRGGIRQCANMGCGVWERFPREFAKCRRCRKAKYCSKGCQKRAWQAGHRYWCSARQDNPPPTGNAHVIGIDGLAVDPDVLIRAAAEDVNIQINTTQLDGGRDDMDNGNGAQEIRLHDL